MRRSFTAFLGATASLYSLALAPMAIQAERGVAPTGRRQGRYQLGGRSRSKYRVHQGTREIARRKRQIERGQLQTWDNQDRYVREAA